MNLPDFTKNPFQLASMVMELVDIFGSNVENARRLRDYLTGCGECPEDLLATTLDITKNTIEHVRIQNLAKGAVKA